MSAIVVYEPLPNFSFNTGTKRYWVVTLWFSIFKWFFPLSRFWLILRWWLPLPIIPHHSWPSWNSPYTINNRLIKIKMCRVITVSKIPTGYSWNWDRTIIRYSKIYINLLSHTNDLISLEWVVFHVKISTDVVDKKYWHTCMTICFG